MASPILTDPRPASSAGASAGRTALSALVLGLWSQHTLAPALLTLLGVPAEQVVAQVDIAAPVITASGLAAMAAVGTTLRDLAHERGGAWAKLAGNLLP